LRRSRINIFVMLSRSSLLRRLLVWSTLLLLPAGAATGQDAHRGRKYKAPPTPARFEVTVVRASSGKPVANAAVIFQPLEGEKDKGNLELKTNDDGKALLEVLPVGDSVRVQVVASGFQTFGQDFKIDVADKKVLIRLNRPQQQYSVYKQHPQSRPGPEHDPAAKPAPGTAEPETESAPSDPAAKPKAEPSPPVPAPDPAQPPSDPPPSDRPRAEP
jgi:hypothetical protein